MLRSHLLLLFAALLGSIAPAFALDARLPPARLPPVRGDASVEGNVTAGGTISTLGAILGRTLRAGRQAADAGGIGGLIIGGSPPDETGHGVALKADGLANWLVAQVTKNYNQTELIVYGAQAQGVANSVSGTGQLVYASGSNFDPAWIGRTFYWNCATYRLASVTGDTLTVTNPNGSAVSFPSSAAGVFHYVRTTTSHTFSVSGTSVTRLSGDPFTFFLGGTDFQLRIGGTLVSVASVIDKDHLTLAASAGTQASVAADASFNIYDQIATLRLQKFIGSTEENLTLSARAVCEYEIRAGIAGAGQYYPIRIKNGDDSGNPRVVAEFGATATTLGGPFGVGPLTVVPATNGAASNRVEIQPSPVGFGPVLRARSGTSDTSVPLAIDTQGGGGVTVTGNSFGQTLFQAFGTTATGLNWLGVGAAAVPGVTAQRPAADISVAVVPKGAGAVLLGSLASNRVEAQPAGAGFGPVLKARSGTADTNVPLTLDTQGSGNVSVTSNSFGQTGFQVFGTTSSGLNWLGTGAATVPAIAAQGPGTNIAIAVLGKGTEGARIGFYTRSADPSTTDIPGGQCADWSNTAAGTLKRWCNVAGTIRSLSYQ